MKLRHAACNDACAGCIGSAEWLHIGATRPGLRSGGPNMAELMISQRARLEFLRGLLGSIVRRDSWAHFLVMPLGLNTAVSHHLPRLFTTLPTMTAISRSQFAGAFSLPLAADNAFGGWQPLVTV